METFEVLLIGFIALMTAVLLVLVLVVVPVTLYTEAQCLERGFPEARVTWKFDRYCMNLDGTVTVRVEKAN